MSPHRHWVVVLTVVFSVQCKATSIVVVVSDNNIVVAADSKKAWSNPGQHPGEKIEPTNKVVIFNKRTVIAISGLAAEGARWDANLFLERIKNSLPVDAHVSLAETVIMDKLKPFMNGFSSYMMDDPREHQKAFPSLLIEFIVIGYENGIPVVDTLDIKCDWNARKATGPTVNPEYPVKDRPISSSVYLMPFGMTGSIDAAFRDSASAKRKAAYEVDGLAKYLAMSPNESMPVPQMIDTAADVVRFEEKFCPEFVGPPIHLFVLSGKNEPEIMTFLE